MSRDERKSAWPPNWNAPTSNETRVRVELLAKIIPSVFPASGRAPYSPPFMQVARSNRVMSSDLLRSGTARKSRFTEAPLATVEGRTDDRADCSGVVRHEASQAPMLPRRQR